MAQVEKITTATDADAEYILRKIREADECDEQVQSLSEHGTTLRIEAGKRLIEIHAQRSRKANAPVMAATGAFRGTWRKWLEENGIAEVTARRHMALAGWTEEEHEEAKEKERVRSQTRRKARTTYGWIAALQAFSGLNEQFGGQQLKRYRSLGGTLALDKMTEEQSRAFAADYVVRMERPREPVDIKDREQKRIDRILEQELAKLKRQFKLEADTVIQTEVRKQVNPVVERYAKLYDEMAVEKERYEARNATLKTFMTVEDYRFVLNCLHPDRAPEDRKERFDKAFGIMKRLDRHFQ